MSFWLQTIIETITGKDPEGRRLISWTVFWISYIFLGFMLYTGALEADYLYGWNRFSDILKVTLSMYGYGFIAVLVYTKWGGDGDEDRRAKSNERLGSGIFFNSLWHILFFVLVLVF